MQCPRCRHENPLQAKFCLECGTRLALQCGLCGTELPAAAKFCLQCGRPAVAPLRQSPAGPEPTPVTYTPVHLAERILTSRAALQGERKQVTVLFADLKGSMELLADRDPEEARSILDPVLERMMEAVHRYEGTVNQVMGDGIMALFGAPLALEDHAVRACYTALRMQETVQQYAAAVRRATGVLVQIRVGLNSGEVVVRSIGSDLHIDYTAVGQTTHLAARMEQMAAPGSILLAPDTLQLAEGYVQVRALGPMPVKGLGAPIEVYEVLGAGGTRTRLQAAVARGLTRFVGRDTELETLRQTLAQADAGRGQVVALVGEPGVGKSRLVWEFTHSHRTAGWLVLGTSSVSYGKATAHLPVIDLLKMYFGIDGQDDARRVREKVAGKVLMLDEALRPSLSALLALLDVPLDDARWQALDPPQRRQRILDAVKRLLLRESQVQPLLLVFEDLHWIDAETQALLDSLVESLPTARILLLVNYRPEYAHGWGGKTYYTQLRLDPLPLESAEELLGALLGGDASLPPLRRLLVERTEGNPFFLEESVRTLVETGMLLGERGAYRLAKPLETTRVPATVQAVLAARIDRLSPEDKRLLQAAAVIGKDVPYPILLAIGELAEPELRERLARLQAAEFLYETSLFPDLEYTFKHALTHEVAYGGLLQQRRRDLHAQIVAAIEMLYPDRQAEHIERLAHHAPRGEVWDQAATYLQQAGEKASERWALGEAIAYFEQALHALGHLPESRETSERGIDVRLALRPLCMPAGRFDQLLPHLQEAAILAERIDDQHRLGRVAAGLASYFWSRGEHQSALEPGRRALAIAEASQDVPLQIEAKHALGQTYYSRGEYARAIEFSLDIGALLEDDGGVERYGLIGYPAAQWRARAAVSLAECGEFGRAIALGEEMLRLIETIDHPWTVGVVCWSVGYMYAVQGSFPRAVALLERGLEVARTWALVGQWPRIAEELAYAYGQSGRTAEATPLVEQAVAQSPSVRAVTLLGEIHLLAGRPGEALPVAERALALARHHEERGNEAYALRLLGEIAARADPPAVEQAETRYRQALTLVQELGMRPLAAHCHLGLGTLYGKVGRRAPAQAELTTAAELYRAMEMPSWLEKAETALTRW